MTNADRGLSPFSVGAVGLTFLSAFLFVGCGKQNSQAGGPPMMPALVTVASATAQNVPVYLDEIGKNAAFESVTVTPQVGGRITERHFEDGAELKKGQLLFVIDPRPYQAQLDSAQAKSCPGKAALDLANANSTATPELVGNESHFPAGLRHQEERRRREPGADRGRAGCARNREAQSRILLHPLADRRPRGRAARGHRKRGAGQHDRAAADSAPRSDLRGLHRSPNAIFREVQKQMAQGTSESDGSASVGSGNAARGPGRLTFLDNAVQNGTGTVNLRATVRESRPSFLARPVRERQARPGDAEGRRADSQPGHANQPKGPFCLRRQAGRHGRASSAHAWAAAGR